MSGVVRFHVRVFLWMAVPFGVIMTLFWSATSSRLMVGPLAGVFFGLMMSVSVGGLHVVRARQRGQPDPNRVHHEVGVRVPLAPAAAFERGLAAARTLPGFPQVTEARAPELIRLRTGWSWESFGERVELRLAPRTDGTTDVVISSRPSFRPTIADYGRNWLNVQTIRAALEGSAPQPPADSR